MAKLLTLILLSLAAGVAAVETSEKGYCVWGKLRWAGVHQMRLGSPYALGLTKCADVQTSTTMTASRRWKKRFSPRPRTAGICVCCTRTDQRKAGAAVALMFSHGSCPEAHSQAACGAVLLGHYNMPMHIASIFIVLVTSFAGIMIPTIAGWFKGASVADLDASSFGREYGIWGCLFFVARHFGTGIIISTAFIHLLYHGFLMFNDPCLGNLAFPPVATAIALAGALITFLFDFVAAWRHGKESDAESCDLSIESTFRRKAAWQVLLLEAGIIFHSVMIGVTLGADSSNAWTTLFIVIIFHQLFEGAA